MHKTIYLALAVSLVLFLSSCSSEESEITSPLKTQQEKQATQKEAAQDSKQLIGWWEETDSWSLDFQTGQLKKDPSVLPFYREFTENYACQSYDSKYHCTKNSLYTIDGNKITYEGVSSYYEEWRIIDGKLELTAFQGAGSKAAARSKSLYKKVSETTSPDQQLTGPAVTRPDLKTGPKANIRFVKAGAYGICLVHEGGDAISMVEIGLRIDDKDAYGEILHHYPFDKAPVDYIFDPGESAVITFDEFNSPTYDVGSKVQVTVNDQIISPLKQSGEPDYWIVDKILSEESGAVRAGGLATCP